MAKYEGRVRILSLNCHKSPSVIYSLLNSRHIAQHWDLLCLQEPPLDILTRSGYLNAHWILLTPPRDLPSPLRSIILIRESIPSRSYAPFLLQSSDIVGITLNTEPQPLHIFSVYNPCLLNSSIHLLSSTLNSLPPNTSFVLIGDFNRHDALWAGPLHPGRTNDTQNRRLAEPLIQLMATFHLTSTLPPGTITYRKRARQSDPDWTVNPEADDPDLDPSQPDEQRIESTIDLALVSESLEDAVLLSKTGSSFGSDHDSLELVLDLSLARREFQPKPLFRSADWEEFKEEVEPLLEALDLVDPASAAQSDVDKAVQQLSDILQDGVKKHVPLSKPSPFSKRWWSKDLTLMRQNVHRAETRAKRARAPPERYVEYIRLRNAYHSAIRTQKRQHWRDWIEEADEKSIWQANKYVSTAPSAGGATRVPPLTVNGSVGAAVTGAEKCSALLETFFPPPPAAQLEDILEFEYPEPLPSPPISIREVEEAIMSPGAFKAPGTTGVPNKAIQVVKTAIAPHLGAIANACMQLAYHPKQWRLFSTITLRKPGKPDYSIPKAYRPIALEDTLSKVVETVVARRLSQMAEEHALLAPSHFGGRPGRTTSDAVLLLVHKIKAAWRKGKVATGLFLDISQAFPTVSHPRLLHNLRKRRVAHQLVEWIASFLSDRYTTLSFDDYVSEPREASYGIPQGSPMSPILYLFYSSDLLEIICDTPSISSSGFIDDTAFLAVSDTLEENTALLETLFNGWAMTWSRTHACKFDVPKTQCVHFVPDRKKLPPPPPLRLNGQVIQPSDTAKYLGVIFDRRLKWKHHVEQAIAKGTASVLAISRLTGASFGMPHQYIRQLYRSVVLPKIEYAAVVWYEPIRSVEGRKRVKGSVGIANRLSRIQRLAARAITGAFRTTATDMLEYHAFLYPMQLRLNYTVFMAAARLASIPSTHPLAKPVLQCQRRYVQRHRSPLHEIMQAFPNLYEVERIQPAPTHPSWKPEITAYIADSKEEAVEEATGAMSDTHHLHIFTDGSGFEGGVGASAVLTDHGGQKHVRRLHLGHGEDHTVFEGEVVGVILALDLADALTPRRHPGHVTIHLDNQPAIRTIPRGYPAQPGQYLLRCLHDTLGAIRARKPRLTFNLRWVPGHADVEGNEWADREAKAAASNQGEDDTPLHRRIRVLEHSLPCSVAASRAAYRLRQPQLWSAQWENSARHSALSGIDSTPPSRKVLELYNGRRRWECSLITQMRTQHVSLHKFLHRIKAKDSPLCIRCQVPETVLHYLLQC
jgi:ribonuclease HI